MTFYSFFKKIFFIEKLGHAFLQRLKLKSFEYLFLEICSFKIENNFLFIFYYKMYRAYG